jgi:hypothetical protein
VGRIYFHEYFAILNTFLLPKFLAFEIVSPYVRQAFLEIQHSRKPIYGCWASPHCKWNKQLRNELVLVGKCFIFSYIKKLNAALTLNPIRKCCD